MIFEHTISEFEYHMMAVRKRENNTKNPQKSLQKITKNCKKHENFVLRLITDDTIFAADTRAICLFYSVVFVPNVTQKKCKMRLLFAIYEIGVYCLIFKSQPNVCLGMGDLLLVKLFTVSKEYVYYCKIDNYSNISQIIQKQQLLTTIPER